MKEWVRSFEFGIQESILLLIIILNFFDAFEILPGDLDYIKKIISWSALAVMLVHSRLDKVLAGINEKKGMQLVLIGFFLMSIKNLVGYAYSSMQQSSTFLMPFYTALITYASTIEKIGLLLGSLCVLAGVIRFSVHEIKKPSLTYALLQQEYAAHTKTLLKIVVLFTFSILFFIGVFSILMEWLAIAIDAPLLMIGLAVFILHAIQHKKLTLENKLLSQFGSFGVQWYEKIIKQLEYRKHLFRVAAAIVALHGITDILIFLWPAVFGIGDQLYLGSLNQIHYAIWTLWVQLGVSTVVERTAAIIIYFANIYVIGIVLGLPMYLLSKQLQKKKVNLSAEFISWSFAALVITAVMPAFKVHILSSGLIYGIDLFFIPLRSTIPFMDWVLLGGVIAVAMQIFTQKHNLYELSAASFVSVCLSLFVAYIVAFNISIGKYYLTLISAILQHTPSLGVLFSLFFLSTLLIASTGLWGIIQLGKKQLIHHHNEHQKRKTIRK